jgi:hypothetical protein
MNLQSKIIIGIIDSSYKKSWHPIRLQNQVGYMNKCANWDRKYFKE